MFRGAVFFGHGVLLKNYSTTSTRLAYFGIEASSLCSLSCLRRDSGPFQSALRKALSL